MRWLNCVRHSEDKTVSFLEEHFSENHRRALLVGGAGFDPRSTTVPRLLHGIMGERLAVWLIKEERPDAATGLVERAAQNLNKLKEELVDLSVSEVQVLSEDLSVIGGRRAVQLLRDHVDESLTDIVVDQSALSCGVGFPLIRFLIEWSDRAGGVPNVHVLVAPDAQLDRQIQSTSVDSSKEIHGFKGRFGLQETAEAAILWVPQLEFGKRQSLDRIYNDIEPHDVCPVIPFPSVDPRTGDQLLGHFETEIMETWEVAPGNLIYAAENNPLDLYRTVLRIDGERSEVFRKTGGSLLVLTPSGSKTLALGAMMAAVEHDLPMRYVESIGYELPDGELDQLTENKVELLHLWLCGEPYSIGEKELA
jgi:GNAT superfamily N-acetyltransferase